MARAPWGGKGQAAGLGALAPVAASPAQGRAEQTLAADAHAQGPVDKGLQLHLCARPDGGNLL